MERAAQRFFTSLSERDQRRFAGLEAKRMGWHGVRDISQRYGLHPHTVRRGKYELEEDAQTSRGRIRQSGGGRKRTEQKYADLDAVFLDVLKHHTAGDPMQPDVLWTNLGDKEISLRLHERGIGVGVSIVKRLLKKHQYRRRKAVKTTTIQSVPERNTQFEQIAKVNRAEQDSVNPVLSIDTKKKNGSATCTEMGRYT